MGAATSIGPACFDPLINAILRWRRDLADRAERDAPQNRPTVHRQIVEQVFTALCLARGIAVPGGSMPDEVRSCLTGTEAGSALLGRIYERLLAEKDGDRRADRSVFGAFYTPQPVVDYLVERTVGRMLDERPRVLDPACGSGAFLLKAYQGLLDSHAKRHGPPTLADRQRILQDQIFGVDIDPVAVDVTRRSLVVVLIDDLPARDVPAGLVEKVLTGLEANIKTGNSLIGAGSSELNGFDWAVEFPDVFRQDAEANGQAATGRSAFARPGFDVVIGNPPYASYSGRQALPLSGAERAYYTGQYETGGWLTAHGLFVERSLKLLSRRFVALIVPDQVGHLDGYGGVRALAAADRHLAEVRYWGEEVFSDAITPALTFVVDGAHAGPTLIHERSGRRSNVALRGTARWVAPGGNDLLNRVVGNCRSLGGLVGDPGVHTGNCAAKLILPAERAVGECAPVLEGRQVSRYACAAPPKVLCLDYRPTDGEYFRIRPRERYLGIPFVIRQTARWPIVGPRQHADYFRNSLLALYEPQDGVDVRYLVGLLNSRLLRTVYQQMVPESQQKAFPQVKVASLRALPMRWPDFGQVHDRQLHDELVTLVSRMLTMNSTTTSDWKLAQLDARIDRVVLEMYGLAEDELPPTE